MTKEMLINVSEGEECRIALLEDGKLEELYIERTSSTSHVGNIYKGRVTNVEPSIQAAFVDFGLGRNGFLHISDLLPSYFGESGEDVQEAVGRKLSRRDRPPIQRCLRRGDEIVVQIIKEGIGTKGPTLSTYLSIPGRILVMMPGMSKMGVSRKIEDDDERRRLRQILDSLKPIKDVGFIIRTAGVEKSKTDIQRDLTYLTRLWMTISKKVASGPGPMELYTEGDLVTRTVRDVFNTEIDRIVVDHRQVAERVREFLKIAMPRGKDKVQLYDDPVPLFHRAGIEREIELMYSRHVPLPSGGSLVIDSTEAVVAIDVNSGKFRDHSDAETTAFKTDLEAADEIPRQLRLRDLGGVIICDFIDLRFERHRHELEKRLNDNLKLDRARTKMLHMSQFGIIEMTRQRMRPSLKRSIYCDCPACKGAGLVKTPESMGLDVMRRLAIAVHDSRVWRVDLAVCGPVNEFLQNRKRAQLAALESSTGKSISIRVDPILGLDEMRLNLFDNREGRVYLDELGMSPQDEFVPAAGRPGAAGGRRDDHRRRQPPPRPVPAIRTGASAESELSPGEYDLDSAEEAVEQREEQRFEETTADSNLPPAASPPPLKSPILAATEGSAPPAGRPPTDPDDPTHRRRRRRGRRGRGGRGGAAGGIGAAGGPGGADRPPLGGPSQLIPARPLPDSGDDLLDRQDEDSSDEFAEPAQPRQPADPLAADSPGEDFLPSDEEGGPRRRRRRRGGRRHRRRGNQPVDGNVHPAPTPESAVSGNVAVSPRPSTPARSAPPKIEPPAPVVRTGSTDRHLISDEPVHPEPVRRPRSYRDLDAIPDDLD